MNGDVHRGLREMIGSYALGHLTGAEQLTVSAHLDGCASCRAELASLQPVVSRLAGVDPDVLDDTPTPPPALGDTVLAAVRADQQRRRAAAAPDELAARRRRRVTTLLATAAAVVLVAGAFTAGVLTGGERDRIAEPFEEVSIGTVAAPVRASAGVVPHTWGVEVKLAATGFADGEIYRVSVLDDTGRAVSAGEFVGTGERTMNCNLNSSVLRQDAVGFQVLDATGSVVLAADL